MKLKANLVAIAVLASISSVAAAQSASKYYLGVSGGTSKASKAPGDNVTSAGDILGDDLDSVIAETGPALSSDKSGSAYKVYLGYQADKTFGLELGYADLGKFKQSVQGSVTVAEGTLSYDGSLESKNTAWFIDGVASFPVARDFSILGRAGVASVKTKSTVSGTATSANPDLSGSLPPYSVSKSKWVPKLGIGAEYQFTKTVSGRLEYERYFKVGDLEEVGFKSDISVITAGIKFNF